VELSFLNLERALAKGYDVMTLISVSKNSQNQAQKGAGDES